MRSAKPGFSLIELMFVITITGILAGITAYNFRGANDRSNNAQLVGNIRLVVVGLEGYAQDNGGKYPLSLFQTEGPTTPGFIDRGYLPMNRLPRAPWFEQRQVTHVPVYNDRSYDIWSEIVEASRKQNVPARWGAGGATALQVDPPAAHDHLGAIRYSVEVDSNPVIFRIFGSGADGPGKRCIVGAMSNAME